MSAAADSALAGADLVACVGGPMDGLWFHRADWRGRLDAARHMGHAPTVRPGAALGYVEDPAHAEYVDHPYFRGVLGRAARWAPDGRAPAPAPQSRRRPAVPA